MRIQEIYERSIQILTHPEEAWQEMKDEPVSGRRLFLSYALPFSLLTGLASFFGLVMFGAGPEAGFSLPLVFIAPLVEFFSPLAVILTAALAVNFLSPVLGSHTGFETFLKLFIAIHTPVFLCRALASIHWSFSWIMLFGLYSVYLLWSGILHLINPPVRKRAVLFIAATIVYLSLWLLILLFIHPVGSII